MHYYHIVNFIFFFFFNDTATTEIYTLSLHDALPISGMGRTFSTLRNRRIPGRGIGRDRKSTRLNSSHVSISYAVFCLKKKKNNNNNNTFTKNKKKNNRYKNKLNS